jgi:hypothetical protein
LRPFSRNNPDCKDGTDSTADNGKGHAKPQAARKPQKNGKLAREATHISVRGARQHNLRDLESVFARIQQNLEPERFFVFDLMTIQGLASNSGDALDYDPQSRVTWAPVKGKRVCPWRSTEKVVAAKPASEWHRLHLLL